MHQIHSTTLQEQLKTETRVCPQCSLDITNPFIERCPRCNVLLPKLQVDCQGCIHQLLCPLAKLKVES